LATIGQATNPAFREPLPGEQATPWQLTLNGLGGTRGDTMTTPDLVMRQVLAQHKKDGVKQLAEIVRASLAGDFPKNTLEPDYVDVNDKGQPVERTRGTVTERFLRSSFMGWSSKGDATTPAPPAGDPFDRALDALRRAVSSAAANIAPFRDGGPGADPLVARRFRKSGLPTAYTGALLPQAHEVVKLLQKGEFIASYRSEASEAADDESEEA
jgi:hypothetical protein